MIENENQYRKLVNSSIKKIYELRKQNMEFTPGEDLVHYSGAVYDSKEILSIVDSLLDGWFSAGKRVKAFEAKLAQYHEVPGAIMVNSGSSANLLAISALCSLNDERRLVPGDEIITPASTFPTTLNPIIQNNLVPVLVDVQLGTYNPSIDSIEKALSSKTKAVFIPHTLGNPYEMDALMDVIKENNLLLIEDACDALGSTYNGKLLGTFGDLGTFSFYPAHQMTTGEGGAVISEDKKILDLVQSLRDWGRSCVMPKCDPLKCPDIECPKAVSFIEGNSWGELPLDYDKRYTYTHVGFNFKPTEVQGAMGLAQIDRLTSFIKKRKQNYDTLFNEFQNYEDYFVLPESPSGSNPCWFAFPLTIKENAPFKRAEIMQWFMRNNIEAKMFFTGNILAHPGYKMLSCRIAEKLVNSNTIMHNSFFLGVYPGIDSKQMQYVLEKIRLFMSKIGK